MRSARRAALLPLVVAAGGVLLASTPALAAISATWSKPTDNSTYTSATPIDIAVSLNRGSVGLTADPAAVYLNIAVPGPAPGPFRVDTASGSSDRDLAFTFTPACPNHAGACAQGSPPAYNGRYTISLSGGASGSRTVSVEVPPAVPTGVQAAATGQRRVKVIWAANTEPDLTGYDVFTEDGVTVASNLPANRTYHEFDLPSSGYGGEHRYVVRAHRLKCANCAGPDAGAKLHSSMSQAGSVTLTEPNAQPSPTTSPSPGGGGTSPDPGSGDGGDGGYNNGTGNGNGGNGTGNNNGNGGSTPEPEVTYNNGNSGGSFTSGTTPSAEQRAAQQRAAFGLTFKSFAPKLGAPKLPPLPKFAAPSNEIPWGTYDPTIDYGDQVIPGEVPQATGGGFTDTIVDSITMAFEGRRLYRSIAIAMLLLLAAAHLRLFLRTTPNP